MSESEMIDRVARALAQVREQNGAAPFEGWDAIHGKRDAKRLREELFEEARAAIEAMRGSHDPKDAPYPMCGFHIRMVERQPFVFDDD